MLKFINDKKIKINGDKNFKQSGYNINKLNFQSSLNQYKTMKNDQMK